MSRLISKTVSIILVLTVVCGGYGNVWCYGDDGHIAVEPLFHNHCDHDHGHKHENHAEHEDIETHLTEKCSPCADILISTDIEPVRIQLISLSNSADFHLIAVNSVDPLGTINTDQKCLSSFFRPLKTIILLT